MDGVFGGWNGLQQLRQQIENDRFIFNHAKILADGSIQGYTANLLNKEYYSGAKNGKLIYDDDTMFDILKECEEHGYSVSIHTNGKKTQPASTAILWSMCSWQLKTSWHACMN